MLTGVDAALPRMFYFVAVTLQHVVNGSHYREHVGKGSSGVSWLPAPRLLGELLGLLCGGAAAASRGPREGLPGDWADVNLSKQRGQNERGRRKVVALERAFGSGTHILLKFTQFPKTSTGETRHIRCPLGNNCRKPSSNQCKQRKEEIYVFMSSGLASGIACSRVRCLSASLCSLGWVSFSGRLPYHQLGSPSKMDACFPLANHGAGSTGLAWISLHPDPIPVARRSWHSDWPHPSLPQAQPYSPGVN